MDIFKLPFLFLCRYRKYPNYFYLVKFGPGFCKYYKKIILKVNIFVYCWIMSRKRAGSRFIANARVYDSCACICTRIFMKFETLVFKIISDHWPPYKISWRSEFSLRRYLQNNIGVCLILNFQCICIFFAYQNGNLSATFSI